VALDPRLKLVTGTTSWATSDGHLQLTLHGRLMFRPYPPHGMHGLDGCRGFLHRAKGEADSTGGVNVAGSGAKGCGSAGRSCYSLYTEPGRELKLTYSGYWTVSYPWTVPL